MNMNEATKRERKEKATELVEGKRIVSPQKRLDSSSTSLTSRYPPSHYAFFSNLIEHAASPCASTPHTPIAHPLPSCTLLTYPITPSPLRKISVFADLPRSEEIYDCTLRAQALLLDWQEYPMTVLGEVSSIVVETLLSVRERKIPSYHRHPQSPICLLIRQGRACDSTHRMGGYQMGTLMGDPHRCSSSSRLLLQKTPISMVIERERERKTRRIKRQIIRVHELLHRKTCFPKKENGTYQV